MDACVGPPLQYLNVRSLFRPSLPILRAVAPSRSGVKAHVWIEARHYFSRADARDRCWLWLLREDGQVRVLVLPAHCPGKDALVVPVPRWSVSWGHPLLRAVRAFAEQLDAKVLDALGSLEVPVPFFGSVSNYNRLIRLPDPIRTHRLQALAEFPPLVAPLLLDVLNRPDLIGTGLSVSLC